MVFVDVMWSDEFRNEVHRPIEDGLVVIVDTFRATATVPVSMCAGVKTLVVLKDTSAARKIKSENPSAILAGEKGGLLLPGFDVGNSPYGIRELMKDAKNKGRMLILNTGNFSRVLEESISLVDGSVICGGVVNRKYMVEYIKKKIKSFKSIIFIATGTYYMEGETYTTPLRTAEDLLGCLSILDGLIKAGLHLNLNERAQNYLDDHEDALQSDESLVNSLLHTHYAKYLLKIDRETGTTINRDDINVCIELDSCNVVPLAVKMNGFLEFTQARF
jgi:phosphosulfolactate phosphohydrolase-like enzyme